MPGSYLSQWCQIDSHPHLCVSHIFAEAHRTYRNSIFRATQKADSNIKVACVSSCVDSNAWLYHDKIHWRSVLVNDDTFELHTFGMKIIIFVHILGIILFSDGKHINQLTPTKWTWIGGMILFSVVLNSFVHIIMYSYYFAALFGPEIQRKLERIKKNITLIQMVCIGPVHISKLKLAECYFHYCAVRIAAMPMNAIGLLFCLCQITMESLERVTSIDLSRMNVYDRQCIKTTVQLNTAPFIYVLLLLLLLFLSLLSYRSSSPSYWLNALSA